MSHPQPVLVVVVNNQPDWQRVVDESWYRIPVKRAPCPLVADYLAFYFTAAFGSERWHVRYYAPVLQYRIVTRRELLPDEPAHPRANEQYYRIDLGPLQQRAIPLRSSRLRRITFIPTTLERFEGAEDVSELWQSDDGAALLWEAFPDALLKACGRLRLEERRQLYTSSLQLV
jgi:hypothetical protein